MQIPLFYRDLVNFYIININTLIVFFMKYNADPITKLGKDVCLSHIYSTKVLFLIKSYTLNYSLPNLIQPLRYLGLYQYA
jgi:hypothetical protein